MSTNRKTRNIALTEKQDAFVEQLLDSGKYQSASEVFRQALRLLEDDLERHQAELDEIRAGIRESMAQMERGEFVEGTVKEVIGSVFDEVRKERGL